MMLKDSLMTFAAKKLSQETNPSEMTIFVFNFNV